jgi:hypothetical protein
MRRARCILVGVTPGINGTDNYKRTLEYNNMKEPGEVATYLLIRRVQHGWQTW